MCIRDRYHSGYIMKASSGHTAARTPWKSCSEPGGQLLEVRHRFGSLERIAPAEEQARGDVRVVERAGVLLWAGLAQLGPLSGPRHDLVLIVVEHGVRLEADGEA